MSEQHNNNVLNYMAQTKEVNFCQTTTLQTESQLQHKSKLQKTSPHLLHPGSLAATRRGDGTR